MNKSRSLYKIQVLTLISAILLASCVESSQSNTESDISSYKEISGDGTDQKVHSNEADEGFDKWQTLLESGFFLSEACEVYRDSDKKYEEKLISDVDVWGLIATSKLFFGQVDNHISNWDAQEDLIIFKEQLIDVIGKFRSVIDDNTTESSLEPIVEICDASNKITEEILNAAKEDMITDDDIKIITEGMKDIYVFQPNYIYVKPKPSDPSAIGFYRSNPLPNDGVVSVVERDIEIMNVLRGEDAWLAMQPTDEFNTPAPDGYEYILIKTRVVCRNNDEEICNIHPINFNITGNYNVSYSATYADNPRPKLIGEITTGDEIVGWLSYLIRQDETNLVLAINTPSVPYDENRTRYIEISEGAKVFVPDELSSIEPNYVGTSRNFPAAFGEIVITENWEIQLIDVMDSKETLIHIGENSKDMQPQDGMNYIAVLVYVRYIGLTDEPELIHSHFFISTGENNIIYDSPRVIPPNPNLSAILYPGGEYQGWFVVQSAKNEENLMSIFTECSYSPEECYRYLLIDK